MLEVGRLCIKTAGRDAMRECVVVEIIDSTYVLVDGNVRRKRVNKAHIEPLNKVLKVKKGADTKEVLAAMDKEGILIKKVDKKTKPAKKEQVKKDKKGTPKSEKYADKNKKSKK